MKNKFSAQFYPLLLRTPLSNLFIDKKVTNKIINNFNDPWNGDLDTGYKILKGYMTFFGETVHFKNSIWSKNQATNIWNNELQSFGWVKDLRLVGSNQARIFLRKAIKEWLDKHKNWSKVEWKSNILAKRICNLLGNFSFFCSSAEESFKEVFLRSISKQSAHLISYKMRDVDGFEKIFAIKTIILTSLSFETLQRYFHYGESLLINEISNQINSDGSHFLKSPGIHFEFLKNLIDIKNMYSKTKREVPETINSTIENMGSILKFYRHGSGSLATFNNTKPVKKFQIDQVLLRANSKIKVPNFSPFTGFQKVSENKLNFIMDCGNPVKEEPYAGSLSFELSSGKNLIIVNCGSPHIQNRKWAEAMKSSAAHSTLSIDNVNSSDIFFGSQKKGRIAKVWSKKSSDGHCYWIDSAHNGYKNIFGVIHNRKIHIDPQKKIIRGQDTIVKSVEKYSLNPKKIFIRFHVHPNVDANVTGSRRKVILRLANGKGWEFICSEPIIKICESIYLASDQGITRNSHILLSNKVLNNKKINWIFREIN